MSKNAIVVVNIPRADGTSPDYFELSRRSIEAYARRIGATLVMIHGRQYSAQLPQVPHLEKLQALDLLDSFDRVLSLDLDILVNPAAPNIFAAYPDPIIHGYDEGYLPWVAEDVAVFESKYGVTFPSPQGWKRLLNGGVMLWSQAARAIPQMFHPYNFHASFDNTAGEQSWVNTMIVAQHLPVALLDQRWNWCPYAHAGNYANRLNAYFIHYASDGSWIGQQPKGPQMLDDARTLGLL